MKLVVHIVELYIVHKTIELHLFEDIQSIANSKVQCIKRVILTAPFRLVKQIATRFLMHGNRCQKLQYIFSFSHFVKNPLLAYYTCRYSRLIMGKIIQHSIARISHVNIKK